MTGPMEMTSTSDRASIEAAGLSSLSGPKNFVPLRAEPNAPDDMDARRSLLLKVGWGQQDDLLRQQQRQIEENVRMVSGQQHSVFHPGLGRWLDVSEWMSVEERRWRARPVFNMILPWFIITHARATENSPIVTFVPGPDRADSELAELLDILHKSLWFEANMEDVHDRLMTWVILAGRGHLLSRINPQAGQMRKWIGTDMVPVVDANDQPVPDDTGEPLSQMADGVPFDKAGTPLAKWRMTAPGQGELVPTGAPHEEPIGSIEVDVLSPLQVRGSWGPDPWWKKRRHWIKSYHTPEEIYDLYGVDVPADTRGDVGDVGELERILYGTGFYNAANGYLGDQTSAASTEGYVEVTQLWEAPCNYGGLEKEDESPGGRWLVGTKGGTILRDGVRPAAYPHTSPLNTFEFLRLPGRVGGTTPQEMLNHPQREINEGFGRVKEHVNLLSNPKAIIDQQFGLAVGKFNNRPGQNYMGQRRPGVPAIEYLTAPPLGADVYKYQEMVMQAFDTIGFTAGANEPGTPGDSGEKVKEVRFNTDRFLGPTMRRAAGEYGRMIENWQAMLPLVLDMETTINYAGDDNIGRTIVVYPEMFKDGKANVRPDVESMLPESRGEKQEKVFAFYLQGMFGLPGSPQALQKFWEVAHMPHLSRVAKPGGIHQTTAERENGKLLLGTPGQEIPVYEWYDDMVHLAVHENFMSSPEFNDLDDPIKEAFVIHRMGHKFNQAQKMAQQVAQAGAIQTAMGGGPDGGAGGGPAGPEGAGSPDGSPPPVRPGPPNAPAGAPAPMPTAIPLPATA